MNETIELEYEPTTPEHVLAVLRDQHRQQCEFDPEACRGVELTFDCTIDDWRAACDLVDAYPLAAALNASWDIDVSTDEWLDVLEPSHERTLAGVCGVIARHAARVVVRPAHLLGSRCTTAGAFLAIRSMLRREGVATGGIRPSTPLADYTRRHAGDFLGPVSELAPGALPPVRIRTPVYDAALMLVLIGFGLCFWRLAWGAPIAVLGWIGTWIAARWIPPAEVRFGDLRTFGDLARVIAGKLPAT